MKSQEMNDILYQEKYHFTIRRYVFIFINFSLIFSVKYLYKNFEKNHIVLYLSFGLFTSLCIALTAFNIKKVYKIHEIKEKEDYNFDENDLRFNNLSRIIMLAIYCMIAALLTGICGILILGSLFLQYKMIPQVMGGTN